MIDYNDFLEWAQRHFTSVETTLDEIKVNSIFTEDNKNKLWCNPSKNAYHCWKSEESGNLFELVSKVTGCSYQEALSEFSDNKLRNLEAKLDKFFEEKEKKEKTKPHLALPLTTTLISNLDDATRKIIEKYLEKRKIDSSKLMFCSGGKYKNRIIIPYYDENGTLIYWNARDITDTAKAKYMGPDAKCGIGKGDVLFMTSWTGDKVYMAEGEFDAMSLAKCGLIGGACGGKVLSDKQVDMLSKYKVCICFDTDKSGAEALNKMGDKLIESGISDVSYVRPPAAIKDWNKMLIDCGENLIKYYIANQEKPFTPWTSSALRFNNLGEQL